MAMTTNNLDSYNLDDNDDTQVTCANGCPDGASGQHKLSCQWAGRQWFVGGHEVRVTGESPDGKTVCVERVAERSHVHVGRDQVTTTRYPEVHARLTGTDSNTFMLIGVVSQALRKAGHGDRENDIVNDVTSAESYQDALHRLGQWVTVS